MTNDRKSSVRLDDREEEEPYNRGIWIGAVAALLLVGSVGGVVASPLDVTEWIRDIFRPEEKPGPVVMRPLLEQLCLEEDSDLKEQCFKIFYATTRDLESAKLPNGDEGDWFRTRRNPGISLGRAELSVPFRTFEELANNGDPRFCKEIEVKERANRTVTECRGEIDLDEIPNDVIKERGPDGAETVKVARKNSLRPEIRSVGVLSTNIDPQNERTYDTFTTDLEQAMGEEKAVLLYIHGFKESFDAALINAAQLSADLEAFENRDVAVPRKQVLGVPISFTWPTLEAENIAKNFDRSLYFESQLRAEADADMFRRLVTKIVSETPVEQLNIVAHSMGNRFVLNAYPLLNEELRNVAGEPVRVHIVHAAADIGQADLRATLSKVAPSALTDGKRITAYANPNDDAFGEIKRGWGMGSRKKDLADKIDTPWWKPSKWPLVGKGEERRVRSMRRLAREAGLTGAEWAAEDRCPVGYESTECPLFDPGHPNAVTVRAVYETDEGASFVKDFDHGYYLSSAMVMADTSCALRGNVPLEARSLEPLLDEHDSAYNLIAQLSDDDRVVEPSCTAAWRTFEVKDKEPLRTQLEPRTVWFDVERTDPCSVPTGLDDKTKDPAGNQNLCPTPADGFWQEMAKDIGDQPVRLVRIEGHADTSIEFGEQNDENNLTLSQKRAEAVKAELEAVFSNAGIEVVEWQTFGFGSSRLAVQTGPNVRERENRRAVITVFFETDES